MRSRNERQSSNGLSGHESVEQETAGLAESFLTLGPYQEEIGGRSVFATA